MDEMLIMMPILPVKVPDESVYSIHYKYWERLDNFEIKSYYVNFSIMERVLVEMVKAGHLTRQGKGYSWLNNYYTPTQLSTRLASCCVDGTLEGKAKLFKSLLGELLD